MYCRVLACDFDGTGASNGRLAPEVASALAAARAEGYVTLLVTGRVLEDLRIAEVDFASFDAVVAENGAVVWWPAKGREVKLAEPPPEGFLADLRKRGVAFVAGAVVVGTWDHHITDVVDTLRKHGMASQIAFNRAALMVVPRGIDKAAGVRRALLELGRSERNAVAFGDAENDRPLLELAEIGVAARGAIAAVAAAADEQLTLPSSEGVAHYIRQVLAAGGRLATPARRRIEVGIAADETPVGIPASGANVVISGDPRCGKSELAGLLAEELLASGYRLCVIDPEGDHAGLARCGAVLALGADVPLPEPDALPKVLSRGALSIVVDLSHVTQRQKVDYVSAALAALARHRRETGMPHWTFVDEAHYFFAEGSASLGYLDAAHGNVAMATYRPSLLAGAAHDAASIHFVMPTAVEEERYFVTGLLQRHAPADVVAADALQALAGCGVGLLAPGRWSPFQPKRRATPHAHHGRKYADTQLPWEKSFYFLEANGGPPPVARSVAEFSALVRTIPLSSLRHHLLHRDFSRWALGTLGDTSLAAGLAKLEHTAATGATPAREEILKHVQDWYLV